MSFGTLSTDCSSHRSSEDRFYSPYESEDGADIFEPCPPEAETRATALASELHSLQLDEYNGKSATREIVESRISNRVELISSPEVPRARRDGPVDSASQLVRWIASLRRRGTQRHKLRCSSNPRPKPMHRPSSSGSSFAFITAVRSATVSLSSMSIVTRPSPPSDRSPALSSPGFSGKVSALGQRSSEDSVALASSVPDLPSLERSIHRRRTLEEIIRTEEAYIGDVRFLNNIYVTIFASLPGMDDDTHSSICQNLAEIVHLHDEILGELHRTIPHSEYSQVDISLTLDALPPDNDRGHYHWMSADSSGLQGSSSTSWFKRIPGMLVEPHIVAEVAKIFRKRVGRFFVYKEYGAQYERMVQAVTSANDDNPNWPAYRKGLEALASILGSMRDQEIQPKRAAALEDLLIKPIQRVCRYPILFSELLKYTPTQDCPNSRMEVEGTLMRLQEAASAINQATGNAEMRTTLEKTWRLQDRLAYHKRELDATSKSHIRSFGHIRLCGVLHICWQAEDGVQGKYMICLLYNDVLCLALGVKMDMIYDIHACINLNRARMEAADSGRGLQCHTAPFSWKLVFEHGSALYEMIMTACTETEKVEWTKRLTREVKDDEEAQRIDPVCCLALGIKSFTPVFGKSDPASARATSIHRVTTVGSKSTQVILKNTAMYQRENKNPGEELSVNRSQSLLTTHRVPVLSPARHERTQLESTIADVWSRNILPFPGLPRSNPSVREAMMRKFSVASITSTLSKRSGSRKKRIRSAEHAPPGNRPAVSRRSKSTIVSDDTQSDPEELRSNKIRRRHTDAGWKDGEVDFEVLREFGLLQRAGEAPHVHKALADTGSTGTATATEEGEPKLKLSSRSRWMRGSGVVRDCSSRSLRGLFG